MTPKTGAYSFVPTIDFAWPTVTNATDYEIQISKTPTFTLPLVDGEKTGGLPALDNFVLPSTGTFYWRVRGINAIGAPGAWSATRTVIHVLPSAPVLVAPVNNSSTILKQPTFSWKPVTGAVKYQVYLDTVNPPVDGPFGNTAALSYKPPSVLPTGTYYWKVVALDVFDNPSPASDIRVVKIVSAPGDVPIPNHFTAANPVKVTFGPVAWTQNGGHYEVQFATNTTFTANLQPPVIVQTGTQFAQPSTPLANGTWYWRVRACQNANASSCGSWSTTGIFTVDT
jgi:hypothetical protein